MAENAVGVAGRVGAGGRVEIRVAHAAGFETDERFPGLRFSQLDVLDHERLPELLQDRGEDLHGPSVSNEGTGGVTFPVGP